MQEHIKNLNDYKKQLEEAISEFNSVGKLAELTQDMLPKDKFNAEVEGCPAEISLALSGRAMMIQFKNPEDCKRLFLEKKANKKTFFQKIFNTDK